MTYVYRKSEPNLYTVGFYHPPKHPADRPVWIAESDHTDLNVAAARVNYLNGGMGHAFNWDQDNDLGVTNLQDKINEMLYKAGIAEHWRDTVMKVIAEAEHWREEHEDARLLFQRQSEI